MFEQTQEDFQTFYKIASNFWKNIPDEAYEKRTGTRDKDWTLHETLAHLLAIAQLLNRAVDAALAQEELLIRGITKREDLLEWNAREIERLSQVPPNALIIRFLKELEQAGNSTVKLTSEQSQLTAYGRFYNRPASVIDFIDWQISHAGIVHAAQVTRPLNLAPLWTHYRADFKHRNLDRFIRQFSMAYWQDYGPDQAQVINLHIDGEGGGKWHLVAAPDGGKMGQDVIDGANYEIFFDSPDIFFGIFTFHESFKDTMLSGKIRFANDFRQTMGLLKLFTPSIPK
jgi:hypothetical protein